MTGLTMAEALANEAKLRELWALLERRPELKQGFECNSFYDERGNWVRRYTVGGREFQNIDEVLEAF